MAVDKDPNRPTVPDVITLVREIYARHCAGCCLHIITDDGNCAQDHADWCLEYAREKNDGCIPAAEAIAQMTDTQRRKLYSSFRSAARPV